EDFVTATASDYGTRSRSAAFFAEILGMISVIEHTRSNLPRWMRSTRLMRAARLAGLRAEVVPSPVGVVGVIGPWNFPVQLTVL
ncbi:aldehyde dehydrogenase family protein, partial [Bacillus cereus group sp. BC88]